MSVFASKHSQPEEDAFLGIDQKGKETCLYFPTWLYSRANPVLVVGLGVAVVMCTPRMNGCCRPGGDRYHQHLGYYNHHDQS